jgi:hypothetical protein
MTPRELNRSEKSRITRVLRRLREHFHEWPGYGGREHELIAFAYYEGCGDSECCGALLTEAAPIALGAELVARHGFRWIALDYEAGSRLGVAHSALDRSIDLCALERGDWCEDLRDSPAAGQNTHESLAGLVRAAGGAPPDD